MSDRKLSDTKPLAAYYAKGFSMREAATKFGISLERVRQLLRRDHPGIIRQAHVGMNMLPSERLQLKKCARS